MESPQDPPLCVAAHPTQRVLALGFKSGAVRVLAVEGPAVWMEANHHTHPITGVWFVNSPAIATDLEESCAGHVAPHEFHHQPSSTGHRELLLKARKEIPGQGVLVISLDGSGCELLMRCDATWLHVMHTVLEHQCAVFNSASILKTVRCLWYAGR